MTRFRVTSFAIVALAAFAAPGVRAQSPKPNQAGVCYPVRYKNLRDIPDESRTYEQQKEFEQLQRACADAAVGNPVLGQPLASPKPGLPTAAPKPAERAAEAPAANQAPGRPAETPAATTPARQEPEHARLRHGFWFSGGLGWGSIGCSDCYDRVNGVSGGLSLGGTLSQHVQLGASSNGWVKSEDGATVSAGTLTGVVKVYPSSRGGFFLLGGVGVATFTASAASSGWGFSATTTGAGAVLGLGYDIRVGRNVSLTPFYNGVGMAFDNDVDFNLSQLGLAVTFH